MSKIKNILCFGDSNTYGYIPGNSGRYDRDTRWTGILQKKLGENYYVIEEGCCGRTTIYDDSKRPYKNGSKSLLQVIQDNSPIDMIIIMLGTNDLKKVYEPTPLKLGRGIETLVNIIENNTESNFGKKIEILIISPLQLGEDIWRKKYDEEFDDHSVEVSKNLTKVYKEIAKRHNSYFIDASSVAVVSNKDAQHLNEEGHRKMACAVYNLLKDIY